jgi:hypothetical protein
LRSQHSALDQLDDGPSEHLKSYDIDNAFGSSA